MLDYDRADWRRVRVRMLAGYKSKKDKAFLKSDRKDWDFPVKVKTKFVWGDPPTGP
jgi:hypothetical protein